MSTFETLLEAQDIAFDLENKLKAIFPNSFVAARVTNAYSRDYYVTLHFALGADRMEWQSGIFQNDPAYMILFVYKHSMRRVQMSYKLGVAGIPVIRNKNCTPEDSVKHILTFFKKHKDVIVTLKEEIF